jgi:hypothetical protein
VLYANFVLYCIKLSKSHVTASFRSSSPIVCNWVHSSVSRTVLHPCSCGVVLSSSAYPACIASLKPPIGFCATQVWSMLPRCPLVLTHWTSSLSKQISFYHFLFGRLCIFLKLSSSSRTGLFAQAFLPKACSGLPTYAKSILVKVYAWDRPNHGCQDLQVTLPAWLIASLPRTSSIPNDMSFQLSSKIKIS